MMTAEIKRLLSELPVQIGDLSEYTDKFEQFMSTHLEPVPIPLVYLAIIIVTALVVYNLAKTAVRFALFVVLPTIALAVIIPAIFPDFAAGKVVLIAGIAFLGLFLFKN